MKIRASLDIPWPLDSLLSAKGRLFMIVSHLTYEKKINPHLQNEVRFNEKETKIRYNRNNSKL